jgi:hypothetical protein
MVRKRLNSPSTVRYHQGSMMAEFAPTLWLMFFAFVFPLMAIATIGIRFGFFLNAARLAAMSACQCKSFQANVSSTQLSSFNTASAIASQSCGGFSGVTLTSTVTNIVVFNFSTSKTTRQSTALTTAADTSANSYNIEVVLTGQISPLIPCPKSFFGTIPGLTAPITAVARSSMFAENPQGLNQ